MMMVAVVLLIGVGGFFGFKGVMHWQAKMNAADEKERNNNAGGGQVAGIAELNDVLARTDPNNFSQVPPPINAGAEADAVAGQMPAGGGQGTAVPTNNLPVLPPAYTLDVAAAKILESKANGKVSRTNFVVETARLDPGTTSHALRLRQGNPVSPEVEVIIYLKLKAGESPAGKTWTVGKNERSKDVASVSKLWKTNPRYAATRKDFFTGYALKLELAAAGEGVVRGKIYLALPDAEQSVVGGVFYAEAPAVVGAPSPAGAASDGAAPADAPMRFRPPQP
jgi:hypothetical protein